MNNILSSSSFVFDKSNSRFSILNIYNDDNDDFKSLSSSNKEKIRKQFKESILKKKEEEKLNTNKCYCCIM
jgi:hypothetical protein